MNELKYDVAAVGGTYLAHFGYRTMPVCIGTGDGAEDSDRFICIIKEREK